MYYCISINIQARTRNNAKLDSDTKNMTKESTVAITKAAELFVGYLALRCASSVSLRGARSIKGSDVTNTIHSSDIFEFLRLDFPKASAVSSNSSRVSKKQGQSVVSKSNSSTIGALGEIDNQLASTD